MNLEKELNSRQREAVLHGEGPLLILAGAGSGKTRVITFRISHLIRERGVPPFRVLAVTFTNKAAGEMRERVERLVGVSKGLWISTFHAFGARVLRRHAELLGYGRDFVIYDGDDAKRLGQAVLRELDLDPELYRVEKMLRAVERAKHRLKDPGEGVMQRREEGDFYGRYQKRLQKANAFDFADLIFQTHRLWERHPPVLREYRERFRHVLVDEFQDTDRAQYGLLKMLCGPDANICVVGDDDQSTYMWRDADVSHILGFERDYPGARVVKLERNYRSSANILAAASRVIARNRNRHEKTLWTEDEPGMPVQFMCLEDEREEADWVARTILETGKLRRETGGLGQVAVFYRMNAQSRSLEESFRLYGLPYVVVGGTRFFDRKEIRDLVAYLRLIANPKSDLDLLRIVNVPARGIGKLTRARLHAAATRADCSIWEHLASGGLDDLRKAEREKVRGFKELIEILRKESGDRDPEEIIEICIQRTGYAQALEKEGTQASMARQENLRELVTAAMEFSSMTGDRTLQGFLQHVSLVTDVDLTETRAEAVSLMTLHAAKGLEFDWVFLVGLEEGMLPHYRALEVDEDGHRTRGGVEEERRLCYVGMTRARQCLFLSCARSRSIFGRTERNPPSRFLEDVPGIGYREPLKNDGGKLRARDRGRGVDLLDVDLDEGDGVVVDYSDEYSQIPAGYSRPAGPVEWAGREVEHASFGRGVVTEARSSSRGVKLVIDFDSVGRKVVYSNYVRVVAE
jgi:DNA helicase-2/ATP-dependent DNA helicase PcrA